MKLIIILEYNLVILKAGQLSQSIILGDKAALSRVFLLHLESFLKKVKRQGIIISAIEVSQTGPSFSALRTVLTFVNLFARQHSYPIIDLITGKRIKLAMPKYNKAPNITKSKF